jgi:hypothetical protein
VVVRGPERGQQHARDEQCVRHSLLGLDVHAAPQEQAGDTGRQDGQVGQHVAGTGNRPAVPEVGKNVVRRILRQRPENEAEHPVERKRDADQPPCLQACAAAGRSGRRLPFAHGVLADAASAPGAGHAILTRLRRTFTFRRVRGACWRLIHNRLTKACAGHLLCLIHDDEPSTLTKRKLTRPHRQQGPCRNPASSSP